MIHYHLPIHIFGSIVVIVLNLKIFSIFTFLVIDFQALLSRLRERTVIVSLCEYMEHSIKYDAGLFFPPVFY